MRWMTGTVLAVLVGLYSGICPAADGPLIQLSASPQELTLAKQESATLNIAVRDSKGAPVSGAALEILARRGVVGDVREIGNGRYQASYQTPQERFPQLEILVARLPGRSLDWLALPLHGTGTLQAETEPGAEVRLEVAGKQFGPGKADSAGKVSLPFEAPPGVQRGTLITRMGKGQPTSRVVELGVPLPDPVMALAGDTALVADGQSTTRVDAFVLGHDGLPLAGARILVSADAGVLSPVQENAPGWYSTKFAAPDKVGTGLSHLGVSVEGLGNGYRGSVEIGLVPGPPERVILSSRPQSLEADGRSRALIEARIEDRTGNPVVEAEVRLSASAGELGPVMRKEHRFHAWLTAPSGQNAPEAVEVTAVAVAPGAENRRARISVPLAKKVEAVLPPPPAVPFWKQRSFYQWTSLGVGIAALVPGAVLTAIDGRGTCNASPGVQCPEVYDTLLPGALLLGTGSALVVTAVILALTGGGEPDSAGRQAGPVRILPGPGQLVVSFPF